MSDERALITAVTAGDLGTVNRLLLDGRVDPASGDNQAIQFASSYGHLTVVDRLLQDGRVDPTTGSNHAIRIASEFGHLSVVDRLLQDKRVDPAAVNNYAVRRASCHGHLSVVNRLLQHPGVNATCLHTYPGYRVHADVASAAASEQFSLGAVQRLSTTLSLPFPAGSRILAWQPRIRAYREESMALAEELTGNWQLHGGGLCRDVLESIVWPYCFGLRLPLYRALDATRK
jgi:hypothetical protein